MMLSEGAPFPSFSLSDQNGKTWTNDDLKGSKAVIYFYPKDNTPGCTAEACEFRDRLEAIPGTHVFGVSPDSAKKHQNFAKKFNLNFPLLADTERSLIDACGLWVQKTFMGRKYMGVERTTYVLDENGIIVKIYEKVNPLGHAAEVGAFLAAK
ncbi:MAG: redoxin domain-containing protein [Armatimonadetes bacterium]|nr:redoxin domain-containing protein [Armatimonadota bacterium]